MDERLIAIATPIFILSIAIEWLLNRWHLQRTGQSSPTGGSGGYRRDDTLTNLSTGIGQQVFDPLLRLVGVAVYGAVQQRWGLWRWDAEAPLTWLVALLAVDVGFYWFHRASHRVRLLWAVHHVHHSSDEYNLAVALRQPWLEKLVDIPFYLPLAVLGLPVEVFVGAFTIDLLYQFFIHTRWVPRLGPLEWLLNTPSHHRVHHGVQPEYLDRNHAGIFIVWDRLFGTFEPEREAPVYGLTKDVESVNPLTIQVHEFAAMWRDVREARTWRDAARADHMP